MKSEWKYITDYLMALKGTTHDYKVEWEWDRFMLSDKMYAALLEPSDKYDKAYQHPLLTLKCDKELSGKLQYEHPEILPGFYMNKLCWISIKLDEVKDEELVKELIKSSYTLILKSLTKKKQEELLLK